MRTHTIIAPLALIAGRLAAGPAAHAAPAPARAAMTPPSTPTELVHDLRAVLRHAGFRPAGFVGGSPPASVRYIRSFIRLMYRQPADPLLNWQVGIDPLQDYLATSLAPWGATRTGDRWVWSDPAVDESVTLDYQPAGVGARALPGPEAELVIVHYTPPTGR